jgi:hypothetical protein
MVFSIWMMIAPKFHTRKPFGKRNAGCPGCGAAILCSSQIARFERFWYDFQRIKKRIPYCGRLGKCIEMQ